jgi:hypothetical protein
MAICSSKGSKIDDNLPLGVGGSKSGDEDDGSGEGFRVLNRIVKLIRRLLQFFGILNEVLLASTKVCVKHCLPAPLSLLLFVI